MHRLRGRARAGMTSSAPPQPARGLLRVKKGKALTFLAWSLCLCLLLFCVRAPQCMCVCVCVCGHLCLRVGARA